MQELELDLATRKHQRKDIGSGRSNEGLYKQSTSE
jgi:hypothetical protein